MQKILVGSTYFFSVYPEFKSKDVDRVVLVDNPTDFKTCRQTSGSGLCLFEWRRMSADEFTSHTLNSKLSMTVGKFLVPEFNKEIGFTIVHLKKLEPVFNRLDERHTYEKVIYESYIENSDFYLTDEQRLKAYEVYKNTRRK